MSRSLFHSTLHEYVHIKGESVRNDINENANATRQDFLVKLVQNSKSIKSTNIIMKGAILVPLRLKYTRRARGKFGEGDRVGRDL